MAKSELQDRLWPNTFVVEKNLANLVGEIRAAIGDDPSNPRFIRTVHRFGYARDQAPRRARPGSRSGEVSFRLKWMNGRVTLEEGEHVTAATPTRDLSNPPGSRGGMRESSFRRDRQTIEDLGSKNGTFVGDQRVQARESTPGDGDIIGVGPRN
jgi:hypothetical protein